GNRATGEGGVIIFNAGTRRSAISLGGNVNLNVSAPAPVLSNLDLTNGTITSDIVSLQSAGKLLGLLTTAGNGAANGGTLVVDPQNINATGLTAMNIPVGVTMTSQNFTTATPIAVLNSTTPVVIGGKEQFTNTNGTGVLLVNGDLQISGTLSSAGA